MPAFVPGADLARRLYDQVLGPVVGVPHAAGLLGPGSDVLGYDTARSADHDWGPRAVVLVDPEDVEAVRGRVLAALPATFEGWPTWMGRDGRPPSPGVVVRGYAEWVHVELGLDLAHRPPRTLEWLALPQQRLLGVTAGPVLADHRGWLTRLRARLARYPEPVWWWVLAAQWRRLAQEEPFVGRAAEVGDEVGSRVLAARQVREVMRLALLLARRWVPYGKWLGTAFAALPDHDGLGPALHDAAGAADFPDREQALGRACVALARRFVDGALGGSGPEPSLRPFWDRPALVLDADRFAAAALARVTDPVLRALPLVGTVDQLIDSTDALTDPTIVPHTLAYYTALGSPSRTTLR